MIVPKTLKCFIILFSQFILTSSENITIALIVESFVVQAGLDDARTDILNLEGSLKEMMGNSAELAFTKKVNYQNINQLLMIYSDKAQKISAILSVVRCSTYLDDLEVMQTNFSSTMSLVILERGCPRPPPTVGFGFPYLKNMHDIVPFLVDIRSDNRLLDKWDDIVIFHDNTVVPEPDEIGNLIEQVVDLARQITLEVDSDDTEEPLDSHNQQLTMDEFIERHEQEQDIDESLDPVQLEGNLTEAFSLIEKGLQNLENTYSNKECNFTTKHGIVIIIKIISMLRGNLREKKKVFELVD
ncbi:UNVERIFIED_CONTAM: hypothetical protein NCL1_36454 [Trichonephila clavipes]